MGLDEVLFLGGDPRKFSSVTIRCIDIANHLGCAWRANIQSMDDIGDRHRIFVITKVRLANIDLGELAKRGTIIWDIIDRPPPESEHLRICLASTQFVRRMFSGSARVELIPHYHCNFEGTPNPPDLRRPGWVGHYAWYPPMFGIEHDAYDARGKSRDYIVGAHRNIGIGLNLRTAKNASYFHTLLNSGIKLINCIGFGIPSVSNPEPSYLEIGADCTLFTGELDAPALVRRLETDGALYRQLRDNCIARAREYHIGTIAEKYARLFASL